MSLECPTNYVAVATLPVTIYRMLTIEFATAAIRRTISSGTAGTDPGRKFKIQDPLLVCVYVPCFCLRYS